MRKLKRSVLEVGAKVLNGKYEILKLIHSKGMANVYLVQDSSLNKQWCMKEIRKSEPGKRNVEYSSLLQEANIMKSLNHANIPRIVTIEEDGDSLFIIMDYVDGMSIKDWVMSRKSGNGRVPQDIAITWMKQICQVMMYLHNRKRPILYRDMKPDNVMIQSDGNIKLLDFGTAIVIKEPGQRIDRALGTKGYAAPEQSKRGNVCDLRSDIYGMGKTFYYMLTGLNPSQVEESKLPQIRDIDSSIPVGIERIVDKCCEKDPDKRYQSCEELLYALQNYNILDSQYRKKIRRKVYLVGGMFITSLFLIVTSLIPFSMYRSQQLREYNNLLTVAQQTGRSDDYVAVLKANPRNIVPYLGLVGSMKVDGVFTKSEEQVLLNYLNPNIQTLQDRSDYGKLAYEIGKLYWLYYEGSSADEGMITSTKWFSDAIEDGYEADLANVYYQLGSFKRNIATSITESEDRGMYSQYWNNLITAKEQDTGELVTLQLNLSIASCISSYAYNLKEDGITYSDIANQINELNEFVDQYAPSIEKAENSYNELVTTLSTLQDKVNTIYGEGN